MIWDATRKRSFAALVLLASLGAAWPALGIEPSPSEAAAPAETPSATAVVVPEVPVPEAFSKDAPTDLEDLRAMESHVRMLVNKLRECTVSVQIGRSQGSGVIVSADGYVLTAAHVIGRPGRECNLVLGDGTRVKGITRGSNSTIDAGLIQITDRDFAGKDWPFAPMASLSSIDPGDWCLALGHPGGFDRRRGSVTRLGRVIYVSPRVLQSDCELVGGDSGGPLFDMQGQVIGVNSRIQESTNANYHVPISAYHDSWDRLVAGEAFSTHSGAFLGVSGEEVESGLRVTRVWEGGAAERAGLRVGDVIVTFESRRIDTLDTLRDIVGRIPPGESANLEILRAGRPMTLAVRLRIRIE
jgi:serine protease Do